MNVKKLIRPIEYVLIVATILECSSLYLEIYQNPFVADMAVFFYGVIIAVLAVDVALHFVAYPVSKKEVFGHLAPIGAILGYAAIFYGVNVSKAAEDWIKWDFVKNFMVVLPLFLILMWFKQKAGEPFELFYKHSDVVCVYSFFNLIVFLSGILNGASMPSDTVYSKWSTNQVSVNFYNLVTIHNGTAWQIADIPLLRNYGIFVEPLLFSVPLVTALFTELFLRGEDDKYRYYKALLLSLTLLSSQTTMGMMIMAAAWGLKAIQLSVIKNKKFYIIPAILLVAAAVAFLYYEKKIMTYDAENSGSIYAHILDFKIGFRAFFNSPVFGGGYQNNDYINQFTPEEIGYRGFSNSIAIILGQGGIMMGLMCIFPFLVSFSNILKKGKRHIFLWTIGPFAVFVVTLVHYHVFLMLLLAFGISRISRFAYDCDAKDISAEDSRKTENPNFGGAGAFNIPRIPSIVVVPAYVILGAFMIRFGAPLWKGIYYLLRVHQWSIGQSAIKAFFFALMVTLNAVAISGSLSRRNANICTTLPVALKTDSEHIDAAAVLLADLIYLLFYNYLYSVLDTFFSINNCWNGVTEGIILFVIFLIIYICLYYTISSVKRAKNLSGYFLALAPALLLTVITIAFSSVFGQYTYLVSEYLVAVRLVTECATGKVYTVDRPALFHIAAGGISYAGTRDGGFDPCSNTTVIFKKGSLYNYKELFDAGYQVTELSDSVMAYSNDAGVIEGLKDQGYSWYRYYFYEQKISVEHLAYINGLDMTEEGALLLQGQEGSVIDSPEMIIQKGKYTLNCALSIDRGAYSKIPKDVVIATLKVCRKNDDGVVNARDIKLGEFDDRGQLLAQLPFSSGGITRDYEINILALEENVLKVSDLALLETPDYITVSRSDVYGHALREAYYNNDSTPYTMNEGYSAIERDYDLRGRVYGTRYYDGDGERMIINGGYSGIRYSYNRQGSVIEEEYFDTEDKPQNLVSGYSKVKYEYDDKGNRVVFSYFDQKGKPVLIKSDYAVLKRFYNDDKLVIREEYYDTKGEPICNSSGIAALEREYDENKRVISERYFGTDGEPYASLSGFFEIRYERDEQGRVILESYHDENGNKMTCTGGYYALKTDRDSSGNPIKSTYLDDDGEPVLNSGKIASISRTYNSENYAIKEQYYDTEGNIVLNTSGYAGVLREYDSKKRNYKDTYIDEKGRVKASTSGIASVVREYDSNNRNVCESYYDINGNPVLNTSGIAQALREYDEYNMTTYLSYADTEGESVANTSGISAIAYSYDEHWITTCEKYFDVDGNPVLNTSQFSEIRREYTKRRMTREEYYDTEGKITVHSNGTSGQLREYDKYGNLAKVTYIDAEGNPVLNTSGYAITTREYDAVRNCTAEYFYDVDGKPINNTSGVYEIHRTFDRDRNTTEAIRKDVDGNQL
ncbi:RHS repeat protein [Butyrivibrio sp. AE2032]|uniref:RHS repeat protein n=1 Tax=Butyrivibrio sp. AE2032 TaxID=1458463 RepID=UPI00054F20F9|nr:RHS repeat protein [Butyrivibrio sp. AE2032]